MICADPIWFNLFFSLSFLLYISAFPIPPPQVITSVMQGLILSYTILHLHVPVGGDVLQNMENSFLLRQVLHYPIKRSGIIIPVSVGFWLRSSETGKSLPMSLSQKRTWYKTTVFQYRFPGRSADFLHMAGKSSIKPDWKWSDEIHSATFVLISLEYWNKLLWAENVLVFLQLYGSKLQRDWNTGQFDQYQLLYLEDSALSERTFFWIPHKKCARVSVWIKSGHSQPDIFCHFREKYRNTYKIKCYDKGFKIADLSASLSFINL